jgi:Beta-propeller repeat
MFSRNLVRILFIAVLPLTLAAQSQEVSGSAAVQADYGKLPLTFELNQGQSSPNVRFLSHSHGYTAFLTSEGLTLALRPSPEVGTHSGRQASKSQIQRSVQFRLEGAANPPSVVGEDPQPGRVNYFFGNNPARWRRNVPTYGAVRYKNVYPGIDLLYYGSHRQLEYDFEIHAGADPQAIEFEIQGASQIELDSAQNLILKVGNDRLTFAAPVIYQVVHSQRVPVDGGYVLKHGTHVGFRVVSYDSSRPLVIDPVLIYSTYLGGSGTDNPQGIAVDSLGNAYVAGFTDSVDFPLAVPGSLANGSPHVFVAKLDAAGSNLIFADYIGGSSQDYGYAIALDASNNVWLTGSTSSGDFPVVNPYQGSFPGTFNAFLTKLSSDGSSLLYSTYLGGNGADVPVGVALDATQDIIVGGYTSSTNFPVANAYQPTAPANQGGMYGNYGFLTKFAPNGSSLIFSTYLGGSSNAPSNCGGTPCWPSPTNNVNGIALDGAGNIYAGGYTNTYDFPVTSGTFQMTNTTSQNALVGFLSKFSGSGSLLYSTYFYETSVPFTTINAVAVDSSGSAFVTGQAVSNTTFPLTTTSICDPAVYGFACSYGFVTKFDPTGSSLAYSTFLGPNNSAISRSIVLDANDDAYILSGSASSSYTTVNAIESYAGGNEILLVELDPTGTSQLWATYLGGSLDEYPAGIAADANNNIYIVGSTDSTDLPVTPGASQKNDAGNTDAFLMKIGPAAAPAVTFNIDRLQYATQAIGSTSASQTVSLRNMGSAQLTIGSITMTGDFAETDNCTPSVPATGSCLLSITFTPTAAGPRTGMLAIADDAAGSPHTISLSGAGSGAMATINPQSLSFPPTILGASSAQQAVTLFNNGNLSLSLSAITVSGDFSETNNCPPVLPAASSCTISVKFIPTIAASRGGSLTFTDDANNSPQTVFLSGMGSDFNLSVNPPSIRLKSGSSASYSLTVTSIGGAFSSPVQLSCGATPADALCSFSSASVTPGAGGGVVNLTVSTASKASASWQRQNSNIPIYCVLWLQLSGLALFGTVLTGPGRRKRKPSWLLLCAIVASLLILSACAGGTGIAPQPSGPTTPAGTYTISVDGSSGARQHSVSLTLVVQ